MKDLIEMLREHWPVFAGTFGGSVVGFLACAMLKSYSDAQAYRAGRTDMEKLIRDRAVVDLRDNQPFRHAP